MLFKSPAIMLRSLTGVGIISNGAISVYTLRFFWAHALNYSKSTSFFLEFRGSNISFISEDHLAPSRLFISLAFCMV